MKHICKNNFQKAREIQTYAEDRAKSTSRPMSRMEAFFLHERIGECLEGVDKRTVQTLRINAKGG